MLSGGRKVDDEAEEILERLIFAAEALPGRHNDELGRVRRDATPVTAYREHLAAAAGDALRGLRIVLDCANGSARSSRPSCSPSSARR